MWQEILIHTRLKSSLSYVMTPPASHFFRKLLIHIFLAVTTSTVRTMCRSAAEQSGIRFSASFDEEVRIQPCSNKTLERITASYLNSFICLLMAFALMLWWQPRNSQNM